MVNTTSSWCVRNTQMQSANSVFCAFGGPRNGAQMRWVRACNVLPFFFVQSFVQDSSNNKKNSQFCNCCFGFNCALIFLSRSFFIISLFFAHFFVCSKATYHFWLLRGIFASINTQGLLSHSACWHMPSCQNSIIHIMVIKNKVTVASRLLAMSVSFSLLLHSTDTRF